MELSCLLKTARIYFSLITITPVSGKFTFASITSLLEVRAKLQVNLEFPNSDSNRTKDEWESSIFKARSENFITVSFKLLASFHHFIYMYFHLQHWLSPFR